MVEEEEGELGFLELLVLQLLRVKIQSEVILFLEAQLLVELQVVLV